MRCPPGHVCEMQDIQCEGAPCPPIPVCVPDGSQGQQCTLAVHVNYIR